MVTLLATQTLLTAGSAIPTPQARDKCPVCGMFVSGYQNWLAIVRLKNGQTAYFDGPKDMFTYCLNPGKYAPTAKPSDFGEILVKDYYTLKQIDARKAYYVVGSDILGPMGKELIPLARKQDADELMVDHKGKKIYKFNEITPTVLKSLE